MKRNLTLDPFVIVTDEEMDLIMESRSERRLSSRYPSTDETIARMSESARLWYVAEFVWLARKFTLRGQASDAAHWQNRAEELAKIVGSDRAAFVNEFNPSPFLESSKLSEKLHSNITEALKGNHLPPASPDNEERKLLLKIDRWAAQNGRLPTRKDIKEMGFRNMEDILNTWEKAGYLKIGREKTGPKKKKDGKSS